ncbi:response regulator [Anaerobacillus isosaccharinicus]|uniref:Response regulator n=1 Tax=Anaerobacillus isosaccharinicus TaxID=1532552 RepID=A0A1S2LI20_9BACI|nr:response regulator [Anaerobacillus isosaccharinicus]QOY38706.1 response regulator [Anaerobacillus isosaccharinicus]
MKTILIIDDNEGIRYTLQEVCLFADFKPVVASNGKEGVQKFLEHQPDLILVDFHMPVMDGLITVRTIRQMDQTTPIIVLTVDERQQIVEEFIDAGANDFALKPIKAPDIISRIRVHMKLADLEMELTNSIPQPEQPTSVPQATAEVTTGTLSSVLEKAIVKGISKKTLYLIASYISLQDEPQTIELVSQETGISYPTVHRYLNHLVEEKIVVIKNDYGKVGRPKNHYTWNKMYTNDMNLKQMKT